MATVGDLLRETREAKGLSLDQVENATHIRQRLLQALEENDFSALPAPVFVKGFLRNYAQLLGLNPDDVLQMYKSQVGDDAVTFHPTTLTEPLETGRRFGTGVWGLLLMIAIVALLAWISLQQGWIRIPPRASGNGGTPGAQSTATTAAVGVIATSTPATIAPPTATTGISPSPAATDTPTSSPTSASATATATGTPTRTWTLSPTPSVTPTVFAIADATSGIHLELEFTTRVWLRVYTDGEMVFQGFADKGTTQTYDAKEQVYVHCGYGSGVTAIVNGQEYGPIYDKPDTVHIEWRLAPGTPSVDTDASPTQIVLSGGMAATATATPNRTPTR